MHLVGSVLYRPLRQHRAALVNGGGTRFFGCQAACGRTLRMTTLLLKGAAPPSPLHSEY